KLSPGPWSEKLAGLTKPVRETLPLVSSIASTREVSARAKSKIEVRTSADFENISVLLMLEVEVLDSFGGRSLWLSGVISTAISSHINGASPGIIPRERQLSDSSGQGVWNGVYDTRMRLLCLFVARISVSLR